MFEGYIYYGTLAILLFLLALFGVLKPFKRRNTLIVILFLTVLPVAFWMTIDLMSRPRPVELMPNHMRPNPEEAEILAAHMIEGERIYLLLMWSDLEYPRYFSWKWDKQMAEQIQSALQRSKQDGFEDDKAIMRLPFDPTLERRKELWAHPVPTHKHEIPKERNDNNAIQIPSGPSIGS